MSKDNSALAERMKWYEKRHTFEVMGRIPAMARLDGKAFHTFCAGLKRPYDERLSQLMIDTTKFLVEKTNARCGYTQSDEITLVWLADRPDSEIFFGGKVYKMVSVLASMATAFFNKDLASRIPEKADQMPLFDCRVWEVPDAEEAANNFVWREQDATRNSVQMAARSVYSHAECENKDTSDFHEMLFQKGINWNDYPSFFKRGTYVRRRVVDRPFTPDEIAALPSKHAYHTNPNLVVTRSAVMEEQFEPLLRYVNRGDIIVHGAKPNWQYDMEASPCNM